MVVSKYKFKPIDVALMFLNADFTRNQENEIITDIFSNYNSDIVAEYRKDINKFRKAIREYAIIFSLSSNDYNEAQLIMKELGLEITEDHLDDVFGFYFRLVKLKLIYTGIDYYRLKLRTVLKNFGYERRSQKWNKSANNALKALGLKPYLKNYVPCNIAEIKLDQMIMIRLVK